MTALMRSVLGGLVWGDAISVGCNRSSVVMRSRWWCEIYGDTGAPASSVLGCDRVDR